MIAHSGISLSSGHYISYTRAPPRDNSTSSSRPAVVEASRASIDPPEPCGRDKDGGGGSSGGGVVEEEGPSWFECDDEVVNRLTQSAFEKLLAYKRSSTPYILLYRKIKRILCANALL